MASTTPQNDAQTIRRRGSFPQHRERATNAEQAENGESVIQEDKQRQEQRERLEGRNLSIPKSFDLMLSSGIRARVEDWRHAGVVEAVMNVPPIVSGGNSFAWQTLTNPLDIVTDESFESLLSKDSDDISMAQGWMRWKIDGHNELLEWRNSNPWRRNGGYTSTAFNAY
jgi:hypothetical protein